MAIGPNISPNRVSVHTLHLMTQLLTARPYLSHSVLILVIVDDHGGEAGSVSGVPVGGVVATARPANDIR